MVQELFPNSTIVCIASGPSLTQEDINVVRGSGVRVLVVNDNYRLCPDADVLYACDARFWKWQYEYHAEAITSFSGLRFGMQSRQTFQPKWGVTVLKNTGISGLELDPSGLKNGRNSGYQAIGLAVHLGASRIILLGYDMSLGEGGKVHWFGRHPKGGNPPLTKFRLHFPTIAPPLKALGIEVLNCSRRSALTCFPKVPLEQALLKEAA